MTVARALANGAERLRSADRNRLTLSLLVLATGKPTAVLLGHPDTNLTPAAARRFSLLLKRAAAGTPLAYLRSEQGFYGLSFCVNRTVLIPRPESELLIDLVRKRFAPTERLRMLDLGTGSGCLAVTLLTYFPRATALATDVSSRALTVARGNAQQHGVLRRLRFMAGNLLRPVPDRPYDILVANLPYLPIKEAQHLRPESLRALAGGGRRGEALILTLLKQINRRQHRPAHLLLEVDPRTARIIAKAAGRIFARVTILKDLAGLQRVVQCTQPFLSAG